MRDLECRRGGQTSHLTSSALAVLQGPVVPLQRAQRYLSLGRSGSNEINDISGSNLRGARSHDARCRITTMGLCHRVADVTCVDILQTIGPSAVEALDGRSWRHAGMRSGSSPCRYADQVPREQRGTHVLDGKKTRERVRGLQTPSSRLDQPHRSPGHSFPVS